MNGLAFRSTASFGKRQEYIAVAELLKRGFDVYMTLVDDQQIDCVVRLPGAPPRYVDIQIKARSLSAKYASTFAAMDVREPRENFLFLFYSEACETYWVMPSLDLVRHANRNKNGKNAGKLRIVFGNRNVAGNGIRARSGRNMRMPFILLGLRETVFPRRGKYGDNFQTYRCRA